MTVRVRFAPSPTGYLHIGGARTALYSYLFAKAKGGKYILRIEDTDLERSKREFEESQIADLLWLGIEHDEGPDKGGDFGPYRQSERMQMYKDIAWDFVERGLAYPCFLTNEELEELSNKANEEKKAPHAYHGKFRDYDLAEAKKRVESGEEHVIRFKNPGKKWTFTDLVRGEVTFPEDMVGDFVIIRSNGMPVYNFCCVVDDYKMEMTHVFRAEEHLNNTCRQLQIYEALGATPPEFAHVSLLVGEDRQKLSKRHGATSVTQYKEMGYLPGAVTNYLTLLGWSHPDETDIFDVLELGVMFDYTRFSKSSAMYDIKKLNFFNEQWLRKLSDKEIATGFEGALGSESEFAKQTPEWKEKFAALMKEKVQLFSDIKEHMPIFFDAAADEDDQYKEAIAWETTPQVKEYLATQVGSLSADFITEDQVGEWMDYLKKELKIKGKPLFMGMRVCLTGRAHGPDLKTVVALTPIAIVKERLK
ncbi:glutamate--tRNA ligase [Halobacteriovorax sp. JY17]|uniref:glutamate--tRNA ligase n=1 Tax=Halobacteriovorax sp. JY17 TaxID=2014617 RepID=UPI000C666241|nr:glutamate--tRNA ligase [Halobacteriovorax sp. JY17]PIK15237.1 MAG: glutamate--tRNA ligase [Halobacteriovorax sp. JY17]